MLIKKYVPATGVTLDATFLDHKVRCSKCAEFDGNVKSLANLCLEGAVLWKRENVAEPEKVVVERDPHRTTKAKLKQIMRYK